MSEPVMSGRRVDAELVEVVHLFRRRRKWRHILAMVAGGVLLALGSALLAAHLTHRTMTNTPSIGIGGGLYAAGVLLFAWGAAAGFTARLARWLPASLVLGVLAVLVLMLAAIFSAESDDVFFNGRTEGPVVARPAGPAGSGRPAAVGRSGRPVVTGRVLAAELLDRSDLARFFGQAQTELQTPGERMARTWSLAIWRGLPDLGPRNGARPGRADRPSRSAALSLTVQYSARRAGRLQRGHRPGAGREVPGLPDGYVRHHTGSAGVVTRVRAGRGDWVVALQLRTQASDDPTELLAWYVTRMLNELNAASSR